MFIVKAKTNPEINVDIHIIVILVFKSPNQFEFSFVCFVTIAAINTEQNALFHYIPGLGNECTYEAYCTEKNYVLKFI